MFLAELIGFDVLDSAGASYRLVDLAIDGSSEPVVRRLHLRTGRLSRRVVEVPSTWVEHIDVWKRTIRIADDPRLDAPEVTSYVTPPRRGRAPLIRVKRDLLDALVIDIESRRATRINDLWLDADEHGIRLVKADLSLVAMIRRLSRGRIRPRPDDRDLVGWEWIAFFRGDLPTASAAGDRHERLELMPVAEIARLADALPYPMTVELIGLLPSAMAADVLEALPGPRQLQVLESLRIEEQAELLARVASQNAAVVIADLDPESASAVLAALPAARRELVIELLRYPRDSVGAVMTNEIATLPDRATVGEAIGLLRDQLAEPDFVYFVYVVDDERRLLGVVTLRDLLIADPAVPVTEVMNRHLETAHALDPAVAAARRLLDTQLLALPVLGLEGRLLGALTVDASVRLVAPAAVGTHVPRIFS